MPLNGSPLWYDCDRTHKSPETFTPTLDQGPCLYEVSFVMVDVVDSSFFCHPVSFLDPVFSY